MSKKDMQPGRGSTSYFALLAQASAGIADFRLTRLYSSA